MVPTTPLPRAHDSAVRCRAAHGVGPLNVRDVASGGLDIAGLGVSVVFG